MALGAVAVTLSPLLAGAVTGSDLPDAHLTWRRLALASWGFGGFLLAAWVRFAPSPTPSRALGMFLSWAMLSALTCSTPRSAALVVLTWAATAGVATVARVHGGRTRDDLVHLRALWGVAVALLGSSSWVLAWNVHPTVDPGAAPFGNMTITASLVALAIPAQLVLLLRTRDVVARLAWGACLGASSAFVLVSSVRAAWLAALLGGAVVLVGSRESS
ncbi:MAG: hypothetical protein H6834_18595, partial [Planctomycetes bacterium]|nr:hypothetical protein [Planctomycetota bacterium]